MAVIVLPAGAAFIAGVVGVGYTFTASRQRVVDKLESKFGYSFASQGTFVSRSVGGLAAALPGGVLTWGTNVVLRPMLSPSKEVADQLAKLKPEQWPTASAVRYAAPIAARLLIGVFVAAAATGGTSAAVESMMFRPTVKALEARQVKRTVRAGESLSGPEDRQ